MVLLYINVDNIFWSVFSRIRTEYAVSLRIQSECGKIQTIKTPNIQWNYTPVQLVVLLEQIAWRSLSLQSLHLLINRCVRNCKFVLKKVKFKFKTKIYLFKFSPLNYNTYTAQYIHFSSFLKGFH